MKYYGLSIGWIVGMTLQLIFFPIFWKAYDFNELWWVVQLSGLAIVTIVAILLDRKRTFPWIKLQWDKIVKWFNS